MRYTDRDKLTSVKAREGATSCNILDAKMCQIKLAVILDSPNTFMQYSMKTDSWSILVWEVWKIILSQEIVNHKPSTQTLSVIGRKNFQARNMLGRFFYYLYHIINCSACEGCNFVFFSEPMNRLGMIWCTLNNNICV